MPTPSRVFRSRAPHLSLAAIPFAVVLLAPTLAHADDGDDATSTSTLRVHALCAEGMSTPSDGLDVTIDGAPAHFREIEEETSSYVDGDGNFVSTSTPLDAAYDATPGHHVVMVHAPDCKPMGAAVDLSSDARMDLAMPIADPWLLGPAGTPDGLFFALAAFESHVPGPIAHEDHVSGGGSYTLNDPKIYGGMLTVGYEHRSLAFLFDWDLGFGSASGTGSGGAMPTPTGDLHGGFLVETAMDLRIGRRIPLGAGSLAGGLGLGGALWLLNDREALDETKVIGYVPIWATATFKPSCDAGVQVGATYRWEPGDKAAGTFMLTAGLVLEPNDACGRSSSISVSS